MLEKLNGVLNLWKNYYKLKLTKNVPFWLYMKIDFDGQTQTAL